MQFQVSPSPIIICELYSLVCDRSIFFMLDSSKCFLDTRKVFKRCSFDLFKGLLCFHDSLNRLNYTDFFFLENFAKDRARPEEIVKQAKEYLGVLPLENIAFHFLSIYRFQAGVFSHGYHMRKISAKSVNYPF